MNEDVQRHETVASTGAAPRTDVPIYSAQRVMIPVTQSFGEYEVIEELGRGGMGVVYKALQKKLDRTVAIKVILSDRVATLEQVEMFQSEARALAKVIHPNVVRIYEADEWLGNHFFAMDFIAGDNLAAYSERKKLDFEEIAEIVAIIARAVDHLHQQGIVHRDLKPSNVLVDTNGTPYVTDFGLAMMFRHERTDDEMLSVAGTPSYMAPEQAQGAIQQIGPRTDVYALGSVLFHLLTGRPPFESNSSLDTLLQVIENDPPKPVKLNPQTPPDLETICWRCLRKQPKHRYESAAALADDLERYVRGEAIETQPPDFHTRLRHWTRREPALVWRLVGLGTAAVIAQVDYQLAHEISLLMHLKIMGVLTSWMAISWVCQWCLTRDQWTEEARMIWAGADVALLTGLLIINDGLNGPLVGTYPLLIASAGLWFRERVVWLSTVLSFLGYSALAIEGEVRGLQLTRVHWHLTFLAILLVMGFVVSHQVHRLRRLTRHLKRK